VAKQKKPEGFYWVILIAGIAVLSGLFGIDMHSTPQNLAERVLYGVLILVLVLAVLSAINSDKKEEE
jgi:hypothetical protein